MFTAGAFFLTVSLSTAVPYFVRVLNCPNTMVLILDGKLEIGAHARGNLCYLICLSLLIT